MTSLIARLAVALQLETAAFETGSKRAAAEVDALGSKMEKAGFLVGGLTKALLSGASAFVGFQGAGQIKELITGALDYASSLSETAQQLGVTVEALQQYRYAASQSGISQDEMDASLAQLTKRLGMAADGAKKPAEALAMLGLSATDASGKVRETGEAIPLIAEALSKIADPAHRAAIETQLFGKAGQLLEPLLAGGAKGVTDLRDKAKSLGIVMSQDMADKADAAADRMSALGDVLKSKLYIAVADNADRISDLADEMTTATGAAIKLFAWLGKITDRKQLGPISARAEQGDDAVIAAGSWVGKRLYSMFSGEDAPEPTARDKRIARAASVIRGSTRSYAEKQRELANLPSYVDSQIAAASRKAAKPAASAKVALPGAGGKKKTAHPKHHSNGDDDDDDGSKAATKRTLAEGREAWKRLSDQATASGLTIDGVFAKMGDDARSEIPGVQSLLDRLFPDQAALRQKWQDIETINRAEAAKLVTPADAIEARSTLSLGSDFKSRLTDSMAAAADDLSKTMQRLGIETTAANDDIKTGFADMAQGVVGSLEQMASAVKGGGFLNILSAVVGLGLQLGGIGAFGKSIQSNVNASTSRIPAFATGTNFAPGGLSLVGERGPELVNLRRGSQVIPNSALGGNTTIQNYYTLPSDEFWGRVNQGHVATAQVSAGLVEKSATWRQSRRIT